MANDWMSFGWDNNRKKNAEIARDCDRRKDSRVSLFLQSAKLITDHGEYMCMIRNVSEGGCMVQVFHFLPPIQRAKLELANGATHDVERVWEYDYRIGLRFIEPVSIEQFTSDRNGLPKRQMRLKIDLRAVMMVGETTVPVTVCDISQQGARIEYPAILARDQCVRLKLPRRLPIDAKVRWHRDGTYGLVFEQTFRLDELARYIARNIR